MAQDLTNLSSRAALRAMISSPELLALRRISLGTINHPGQRPTKYLAGGLRLTDDERARIGASLVELRSIVLAADDAENRKARLALVTTLLLAYPMAGGSEASGRARAEAYLVALDDVPPWSIADGIKRWHRGECGADRNYRFAPSPAELREVAREPLSSAIDAIRHLEDVLAAPTLDEALNPRAAVPSATSTRGEVVPLNLRRA